MKLQHLTVTAQDSDGFPIAVTVELEEGDTVRSAMTKIKKMFERAEFVPPSPASNQLPNTNGQQQSFIAQNLSTTFDEGKQYFKVRGAQFSKFGVAIYPEMLQAAGIEPDSVDPREPLDLAGWTAFYVLNENGKPRKVTKLVAPTAGS